MKFAICYENESGAKLYYAKKGSCLTANVQEAKIYPSMEHAEVGLKKVKPDSFPKQYKGFVSQLKIVIMDEKLNHLEEVATQYLNMGMDEFKEQLQGHLEFIAVIPFLEEQIKKGMSKFDSADVQDFMHIIEFGELDVSDSISLVQAMKQSRDKRRQYKLKQELLKSLVKNTTVEGTLVNMQVFDEVTKVAKTQAKDKKWTFKNENLEHYFSYLLERTGNYAKKEKPANPGTMKLAN